MLCYVLALFTAAGNANTNIVLGHPAKTALPGVGPESFGLGDVKDRQPLGGHELPL